jgi:hypothetical protein
MNQEKTRRMVKFSLRPEFRKFKLIFLSYLKRFEGLNTELQPNSLERMCKTDPSLGNGNYFFPILRTNRKSICKMITHCGHC